MGTEAVVVGAAVVEDCPKLNRGAGVDEMAGRIVDAVVTAVLGGDAKVVFIESEPVASDGEVLACVAGARENPKEDVVALSFFLSLSSDVV